MPGPRSRTLLPRLAAGKCPLGVDIARFAAGVLAWDDVSPVVSHVLSCIPCARRLFECREQVERAAQAGVPASRAFGDLLDTKRTKHMSGMPALRLVATPWTEVERVLFEERARTERDVQPLAASGRRTGGPPPVIVLSPTVRGAWRRIRGEVLLAPSGSYRGSLTLNIAFTGRSAKSTAAWIVADVRPPRARRTHTVSARVHLRAGVLSVTRERMKPTRKGDCVRVWIVLDPLPTARP